MNMNNSQLYDVTLRDGNHALRHSLSTDFVSAYCEKAEKSGVWAVEVGHGNGLGASSHLVGKALESDAALLTAARSTLRNVKLAVHSIPGFATINRDIIPALDIGVDIFRVATHVSEADISQKHIEFLANRNVAVQGVLMMSHMIDINGLIKQAKLMCNYGASAIILMDSAGYFTPKDVAERVSGIKCALEIEVGFHAHNNLGLGVGNALTAIQEGASFIDGASMGLGAGAGNAQLENIVAAVSRENQLTSNISDYLQMSKLVEDYYPNNLPRTTSSSTQSGLAGVFSGYAPQVSAISTELGVDTNILWKEMASRKLVAGQESMIREIAQDLMNL
jgi:4-hydroxy 2-oxovalerate aldolase